MSQNQIALRQAFKAIKDRYAAEGRSNIVTPSDLRLEVKISQNKTTYQFFALQQDTNPDFAGGSSNTEIRLNQNDSFHAVLAGLYCASPSSDTSPEFALASYPNPNMFSAAKAAAYQMFFNNSFVNININNVQYIQKMSTARFRNVGVSQLGLGATSSTAAPANVPSTLVDQFNGNDDGLTSLGSIIEISGQKKSDIQLVAPAGLSTAPGSYDRLIFMFRGYLALNAATR